MSTKTSTNQSSTNKLNYDPASLGNYATLTGAGTSVLQGYMNSPFNNAFYNQGLAASQKAAAQGGQNNMGALQQMMRTSGMSGQAGTGFQQAQQAKMGRANQTMFGMAATNNVLSALQRQMQATGMGMSFSPLLKGTSGTSQSQQTTGGLGTWLPQLLGTGLGMATGGLSGLGGGMMGAMTGGSSVPGGLPNQATAPSGGYGFGSIPGQTGFSAPPTWMMGGQ